MTNEVGRELAVAELKPRSVVVIAPPERNMLITMWVKIVDMKAGVIGFYSGDLDWLVLTFIRDGKLVDDQGRRVRTFEFLGKA